MPSSKISILLDEWSDELLHNLSETTSSCIALTDESGKTLFANNAVNKIARGFDHTKLMHPSFEKLLQMDNSKTLIFRGFLTIGESDKTNNSIVAEVFRKNNMLLIIGGINASQLMEQNQILHHLNSEINNLQRQLLAEKKELLVTMEKLNEANEKLKISNAAKDKFFDIIAHDLKNPFNTILGFSGLLSKKIDKLSKEKIQYFADTINASAKNTFKLLENLLEWSRSQTGRVDFKPEKRILQTAVSESTGFLEETAQNKSITIQDKIPENLHVYADANMLSTILRNLISNAVKFTPQNGKITVSARPKDTEALIQVTDDGIGIDDETKEKLFSIHEKTTKTGTNDEKGTGLGLLLCQEFVETHGGRIWAESKEGEGSTFSFTLPLEKKSLPDSS